MNVERDGKLVIIGASGHARVVADVARRRGFEIVGFIDDLEEDDNATFLDKPVLGDRCLLPKLAADGIENAFVAIGDGRVRGELAHLIKQAGLTAPALIHPESCVADDARLGAGTLVAAGAIVNPNAVIGDYVIVNSGSIVEHDCVVDNLAHVSPGAVLAGGVHLGEGAWVGAGATIIDHCTVGAGAVVGAGSVVIENVAGGDKVVGVPARKMNPAG